MAKAQVAARHKLGISYGPESALYSFPGGHPMSSARAEIFGRSISRIADDTQASERTGIVVVRPKLASIEDLLVFHTKAYVDFVRAASRSGEGYLDFPDTPAFPGVFEASLYAAGSTLYGLQAVENHEFRHFFNPIGGLHHAARDRASGFCVFDDAAIAIARVLATGKMSKVAYVDIDAHHGDGVFYGFESDPRVTIVDIHEDGRSLFPGTGAVDESGKGTAKGTKMNLPLPAGSGDAEFMQAFDAGYDFLVESEPDFIFFQCGADGLLGDPLTHLRFSSATHAYAAKRLHELSHETCGGCVLAMGGGGYNPENVDAAWSAVVREFSSCE
jgi:acetoin utilization protein AcuC